MQASVDPLTGQLIVLEAESPVLQYNYETIQPGEVLDQVSEGNVKYTRARSNYLHPLYGLDGEELTLDWSIDHPHHRGIYWAWPEVQFGEELGDLHALQRVFARPTGQKKLTSGADFAEIEAVNSWLWDDQYPIVNEMAVFRVHQSSVTGRIVDLEFHFTALVEGVTVARRNTELYGGLNIRLAPVEDQEIRFHTDVETATPRLAWAELSGVFERGQRLTGLSVFQHPSNPDYPGDWVEYPELNWFQPTFPASGTRYELKMGEPLTLRFRLWIHEGSASEEEHAEVAKGFINNVARPSRP